MKKFIACLVLICMMLTVLMSLTIVAQGASVSTDKSSYFTGESINVTAVGTGNDWVGLYLKNDNLSSGVESIYWYYVAMDGNESGQAKNIKNAENKNSSRSAYFDIPAGEYTVYLFSSGGYTVLDSCNITVSTAAPESASYKPSTNKSGMADGKLTITAGQFTPTGYTVYWANEQGPLAGYSSFLTIPCKGKTTEYTMPAHTLIPNGADRLLVYAQGLDTQPAVAMLSEKVTQGFGTLKSSFVIIGDTHVNKDDDTYGNNFKNALADIKTVAPTTSAILINGDITDHGTESEYAEYKSIINDFGTQIPVYAAIGNHDYRGGKTDAQQIAMFLDATKNQEGKVYFDKKINGVHCIFLGSERNSDTYDANHDKAYLSNEQLNWLKNTLETNKDSDEPIFIFLHQGIKDTVAGTLQSEIAVQKWHGVVQEAQLRNIIKDYPQVVMFAGHSHWTLQSNNSMTVKGETLVNYLNTASVAYLWDDKDAEIQGSQGYFVDVYEDKIIFRGRDFANKLWIPEAQFILNLSETEGDTPKEPESDKKTEVNPIATDAETTPSGTEGVGENASNDATDSQESKGGGCSSAIGGLCVAYVAIISVPLVLLKNKKKYENKFGE